MIKHAIIVLVQDETLSLSVPRQRRRRRRKVEIEAERAAKRRNLMEMVAQLRESHASEGQAQAIDLTKALHGVSSSSSSSAFPGAMASSAALKAQMELLQAGASSRPRANGSLLDTELPNRRKRGRRKNVEGLELLFMGNKRGQLNVVRILSGCDVGVMPFLCGTLTFKKKNLIHPFFSLSHFMFLCFYRKIQMGPKLLWMGGHTDPCRLLHRKPLVKA